MREWLFAVSRRLDRGLLPWMGPAQIGAGRAEEPYSAPTDAMCPVCGDPFVLHRIERPGGQTHASRLVCPRSARD